MSDGGWTTRSGTGSQVRLFLDANVLFAAAWSESGRAAALFSLAARGRCTLLTSPYAAAEARRNIAVKRPGASPRLEALLAVVECVDEPGHRLVRRAAEAGLPDDDAPILAAAVTARADLLVTGDRTHFGHLFRRRFGGAEITSLADALARLL